MVLVTVGVVLATVSFAETKVYLFCTYYWKLSPVNSQAGLSSLLLGVGFLVLCLFAGNFLGLYQEMVFKKYGNDWAEGMFYLVTDLITLMI